MTWDANFDLAGMCRCRRLIATNQQMRTQQQARLIYYAINNTLESQKKQTITMETGLNTGVSKNYAPPYLLYAALHA